MMTTYVPNQPIDADGKNVCGLSVKFRAGYGNVGQHHDGYRIPIEGRLMRTTWLAMSVTLLALVQGTSPAQVRRLGRETKPNI